jgi:hypothetical protein
MSNIFANTKQISKGFRTPESLAQRGLIDEKTKGRKSRDTAHLNTVVESEAEPEPQTKTYRQLRLL